MVNAEKGFGFIHPESGGNDVSFFTLAICQVVNAIVNQGDKLSFVIGRDDKTGKTRAQSIQTRVSIE